MASGSASMTSGFPGRPDIVFPGRHAVVFVNGCFWHGHEGCRFFKVPDTRREFWLEKIRGNRARDALAIEALESKGGGWPWSGNARPGIRRWKRSTSLRLGFLVKTRNWRLRVDRDVIAR